MLDVVSLVNQYGSSLFLLWELEYRNTLKAFSRAFNRRYDKCLLAYSCKTNNLQAVIDIARQEGYGAEVVSEFEYDLVERLGIAGAQTVYNGPMKTERSIEKAVSRGSIINIDSFPEIELISRACLRLNKNAHVGIRINVGIGDLPWSKFGFAVENSEALVACQEIMRHPHLSLEGIHLHLGTNIIDLQWFESAVQETAKFAKLIEDKLSLQTQFIDLGGGFASRNAPPYNIMPDEWIVPSFDEYADVICNSLIRYFPQPGPLLILEPGRALIGDSMSLITRIVSIKNVEGRKLAIVDAGINVIPSTSYLKHPIKPVNRVTGTGPETIDIFGPLCTQYDVLGIGVKLPDLYAGDLIEIGAVGAYTLTFSSQFSFPRPAVLLIRPNNGIMCIQRAEKFEDLIQRDLYFNAGGIK